MSVISDLYEALSIFGIPVRVHSMLNVMDGKRLNTMNEVVPFTDDDLNGDVGAESLVDPVVPQSSCLECIIFI